MLHTLSSLFKSPAKRANMTPADRLVEHELRKREELRRQLNNQRFYQQR
jgi:hypothetical protein